MARPRANKQHPPATHTSDAQPVDDVIPAPHTTANSDTKYAADGGSMPGVFQAQRLNPEPRSSHGLVAATTEDIKGMEEMLAVLCEGDLK